MTRQPILLDPFQGVGAGQRAVLNITPGYRYHELVLNLTATTVGGTTQVQTAANMQTHMPLIELVIANKVQRTYTTEELVMIRQLTGDTVRDGYIHIPFSEKDRNTIFGEEALAWGTGNLRDPAIQLRVTLDSTAYNPTLVCYAERDLAADANGRPLPIGAIVKTYEVTINVSAAGTVTWSPDISRGDKIRRVHVKDSGHITAVKTYANNILEYDATSGYNTERLKQAGFTPQSNWFHVVHDIEKGVLSNLDTVRPGADGKPYLLQSLGYKFTFDASGNYVALVEVIGNPD